MGQPCSTNLACSALKHADRSSSNSVTPSKVVQNPLSHYSPQHSVSISYEPILPIRIEGFRISRRPAKGIARRGDSDWQTCYSSGSQLGTGATSSVFEGHTGSSCGCSRRISQPFFCITEGFGPSGRRVAVKRFKRSSEEAFKMELAALDRVGVHPNVVRLLEDFQGFSDGNVLIYEYCDGTTLWDIFVQEQEESRELSTLFIGRMLQQLLLALEHIHACRVEHRDVKPENIFLFRLCLADERADLKLGDLGWAGIGVTKELPAQGAGSLWYAPPELNPPVVLDNDTQSTTTPMSSTSGSFQDPYINPTPSENDLGKSDMWSTGVVLYLLMVGRNPFHAAEGRGNHRAVEQEVLRLVARGQFDDLSVAWKALYDDSRDIIRKMLKVSPASRPSATDALKHPFLMRALARSSSFKVEAEPAWRRADRESAWANLDGFQRLAWVALARAVGEPELHVEVISAAIRAVRVRAARGHAGALPSAYLLQLAREMSAVPMSEWLVQRSAWDELLRLAFSYLDVDGDNVLSSRDLAVHLAVPADEAEVVAKGWVSRWQEEAGATGLDRSALRSALVSIWSWEDDSAGEDGLGAQVMSWLDIDDPRCDRIRPPPSRDVGRHGEPL